MLRLIQLKKNLKKTPLQLHEKNPTFEVLSFDPSGDGFLVFKSVSQQKINP